MIDKTINKLHLYEKKLLKQLKEDSNLTPEEIAQKTKMPLKAVTSAAGMLSSKNIISMHKNSTDIINLSKEGEDYAKNGLPEYRILKALQQFKKEGKSEVAIDDIIEKAKVTRQQMNFAIGTLMRNQWARMNQGKLAIQPKAEEVDTDNVEENKFLKFLADHKDIADNEIPEEFKKIQKQFSKRKELFNIKSRQDFDFKLKDLGEQILDHGFEIQDEATQLTHEQLKTGSWKNLHYRGYDINASAPKNYPGKIHPLQQTIEEIRDIFIDMGFDEAKGTILESAFWNFDMLFQPQDHAAREMQDTFYVKNPPKAELPSRELVEMTKAEHEHGGNTGSEGWKYQWNEEVAKQIVLRTHTTGLSVRHLSENEPPLKMFSVGRVFRRETINYKHLPEFHQVEGIVAGEDMSFKNLLGILKQFYKKLGFKVRFRPAYFPYTYLSVESEIYVPEKKSWMELGGSGMFRPEVLEPLGVETQVAAFGLGIERLAMMRYGIEDIRMLYQSDIGWLRNLPVTCNIKQF
ncbi:MAG: phenylalanine--tRNA ligase subunit alpha [Methanosphaera sp.]|uniref:phenylalanine--tRNA ligase subunit alpha n=1 Tax=Methanosphaera sp. TaxID=2666342 RepID=UPI0025EDC0EC|nr:phenylalanine--tRNA ligase subunit alpha [Methanosphaera sp.]MCI5867726.1 phenylalanine--tRNA ligase subunit alpha [Methanosphaera sp.]MDD6535314.1 phenylalanine--tRNA ligase subunit alpha [Methanosphaera sp.]MDY3956476.1 phenylalanine--tRNA ligase subunit alpha [Methanosphaera sp.]